MPGLYNTSAMVNINLTKFDVQRQPDLHLAYITDLLYELFTFGQIRETVSLLTSQYVIAQRPAPHTSGTLIWPCCLFH